MPKRRVIALTCVAFAVLTTLAAMPAEAATASTTLQLSGRDAADPANQASVPSGGTLDWITTYDSAAPAPSEVQIDQAFSDGQTVVPDSLQVPEGWTVTTSTDGGSTYEPDPPSAETTDIRVSGLLAPGGRGKGASLPTPSSAIMPGGATNGDGWVPILYKNLSFNVYHHKQPGPSGHIMCVDRTTGLPCPGYPARISSVEGPAGSGTDDMATVGQPNVYIDSTGAFGLPGDMYFPVQRDDDMGISCFNLELRTNCGYHPLGNLKRQPAVGIPQMWDGIETSGTRLFGLGGDGNMYCYDMATESACAGAPYATGLPAFDPAAHKEFGTGASSGIGQQHALIDGRVYSVLNYTTQIDATAPLQTLGARLNCFDPATDDVCAGWSGNRTIPGTVVSILNPLEAPGAITSVFEWRSAAGTTKGICAAGLNTTTARIITCYDPSGAVLAAPAEPPGLFDGVPAGYTPMRQLQTGSRMYLATLLASPTATQATGLGICYDWIAAAQCDGFDSPQAWESVNGANTRDYGYSDDGSCLWGLGDTGFLWSFDRDTGSSPCKKVMSNVQIEPSTEFYCDGGSGHARAWTKATVTGIDLGDVDSMVMTVRDADGTPIPGFERRDLVAEGSSAIDLSSIPIADKSRLQASVAISTRSDAPWRDGTPRLVVSFDGDPIQICVQTTVVDECSVGDVTDTATSLTEVDGVVGALELESRKTMNVIRAGPECGIDVAVQKDDSLLVVEAESEVTYAIRVSNNTGVDATGVQLVDTLPAHTEFRSASDGASAANGKVTWAPFDLAAGATREFSVVVTTAAGTPEGSVIHNGAGVTDDGTHGPDADPSNNDAGDDTRVVAEVVDPTDPTTPTDPPDPDAGGDPPKNGSPASGLPFTGASLSWLLQAGMVTLLLGVTFAHRGGRGGGGDGGPHRRNGTEVAAPAAPPFPTAARPDSRTGAPARWQPPR